MEELKQDKKNNSGNLIVFGKEARDLMFKGINTLADAVSVTLGPKGKTVVIYKSYDTPVVTKDGVTVAKAVESNNLYEQMGIDLVKQVSQLTHDNAGDGTTSSIILARAIIKEGLKLVDGGTSAVDIKKGIDIAKDKIVAELKRVSKPVNTCKDMISVATISANNDKELGNLIGDTVYQCRKDGVITIEESTTGKTYSVIKESISLDRGIMIPGFVTNFDKYTAELDGPYVLLSHDKIGNPKEILDLTRFIESEKKPLLVIAEDISESIMEFISKYNREGVFQINVIKTPGFGENKYNILQDISKLTGATVVSRLHSNDFKLSPDKLGVLVKSFTDKESTILYPKDNFKENIIDRTKELNLELVKAKKIINNSFEIDNIKNRLAMINGSIGVIYVGGISDIEIQEKTDRVDDAVKATQAAIEEGIVPGGGIALIKVMKAFKLDNTLPGSVINGSISVLKSLGILFTTIANNANSTFDPESAIATLSELDNTGIDMNSETPVDMIKEGIIDPTKVTRNVVENACSVAGLVLTTECVIGI